MLNNPQPSLKQEERSCFYFPPQGPLEICLLEYAGAAGAQGWIVLTCARVLFFFCFAPSTSFQHVPATWTEAAAPNVRLGGLETSQGLGCDAALGKHGFLLWLSVWAGNKEADQT